MKYGKRGTAGGPGEARFWFEVLEQNEIFNFTVSHKDPYMASPGLPAVPLFPYFKSMECQLSLEKRNYAFIFFEFIF